MKVCPKCQTKIEEANKICKICGAPLSGSHFQDKKEKVLGKEKKKTTWFLVSLVIIVIGLGGIAYWIFSGKKEINPKIASQQKVVESLNYTGQNIPMTDIQVKVENGKIFVPLDVVKEKKMVRFEYEGKGLKIPLLAYITLAGRVVTAISMCEPCKSTRFHIKDKSLVCNACYTEWSLETLKGISGGCMNYPPEVIPSNVEKDQILIDENLVLNWKPRV